MSARRIATIAHPKARVARFGYTPLDQYRRIVIYTATIVHVIHQSNDNSETTFLKSKRHGICAIQENAKQITIDVVDTLAHDAIQPFGPYIGIRISRSDQPDYASKIVFYMKKTSKIEHILKGLARVMYGYTSATATRIITDEQPSVIELCDRHDYDFPFDYGYGQR